jgi:hypothetical protein
LCNPVITRIYEFVTELFTALVLLNTQYKLKYIESKITDVATCKVIEKVFLDVNKVILIKYNYQTASPRALCESTDVPAGQPVDNLPNSDGLGDVHQTIPELAVWMY